MFSFQKCFVVSMTIICSLECGSLATAAETHDYSNAGVTMSDAAFNKKVAKFRSDVLSDQKTAVSADIDYPMKVYFKKRTIELRGSADLMKNWDKIFSKQFIKAIREAKTTELFSRDQGVMLGDGQVWFNENAKVKTFNVVWR